MENRYHPPQSVFSTGIRGRCPRCGEGHLFDGFLATGKSCAVCDLDLAFADSGDGPAVFIILAVGTIVGAMFFYVELAYRPPYWVHAALWLPAILILSLGLLRPFKGVLVALQYRNQAHEGRLDSGGDEDV